MASGTWAVASLGRQVLGGEPAPWTLAQLIFVLVGLAMLKALFNYLEHFLGHLVAFKSLEILRVELYRRLVPLATQLRQTSGDLVTRATKDIDRIEVFFAHTLAPAVTAVMLPLLAVLIAIPTVGLPTALITALGLALNVIVVPSLGAVKCFKAAQAVNVTRADIAQHVTDSIQGMAEVTGYGHTSTRLAQQQKFDEELAANEAPRGRWISIRNATATLLSLGTVLLVAVVGTVTESEPVKLIVWAVVVWGLFDVTAGVREFAGALDGSLAAAERVYEIATLTPKIADPKKPQPLADGGLSVELNEVAYIYPSERVRTNAVTGIDLSFPTGSHTCLIGTSGSGKSTILKLLVRLDDPTSGTIRIGGRDIRNVAIDELRSRVLLVEQTPILFNGTVAYNLRLATPDASDEELRKALQVVALWDELADRGGLDLEVGEQANLLSGGQRQRLALARAVLLKPDVLLLDEFTAHLDHETSVTVRRNIRDELPETTIVEATHSPIGLMDADQIVVLDNGRVQVEGTPAEVRESGPLTRLMTRVSATEHLSKHWS